MAGDLRDQLLRVLAEQEAVLEKAVRRAMYAWLPKARAAVGEPPDITLLAAGLPNPDAIATTYSVWADAVESNVRPALGAIFEAGVAAAVGDVVDLELVPVELMRDVYWQQVQNRIVNVPNAIYAEMTATMNAMIDGGTTIPKLSQALGQILTAAHLEGNVTGIARTESTAAHNAGTFNAWRYADDLLGVETEKVWIATRDTRTRHAHRLADEQRVPLAAPFIVGGWPMLFPGDPTAPPGLTVNCRCAMIQLEAGEAMPNVGRKPWPTTAAGWTGWTAHDHRTIQADAVATQPRPTSITGERFHLPGEHDQRTHGRRYSFDVARGTDFETNQYKLVRMSKPIWQSDREPGVYGEKPNEQLYAIAEQQGFTGHARTATREEIDQLDSRWPVVFRGVRATDSSTAAEIQEELRSGEVRYGVGRFGSGIYFGDQPTAEQVSDGSPESVIAVRLHPDAYVVDHDRLEQDWHSFVETYKNAPWIGLYATDLGNYAAMRGVDAIRAPYGEWVVLNRTALMVEGAEPDEAQTAAGGQIGLWDHPDPIANEAQGGVDRAGLDESPAQRAKPRPATFHLPGKHDQRDHGRRYTAGADLLAGVDPHELADSIVGGVLDHCGADAFDDSVLFSRDTLLGEIARRQSFDGRPGLVSTAEMDALEAANEGRSAHTGGRPQDVTVWYRGGHGRDGRTAQEQHVMLRDGDRPWYGKGIFGNGLYFGHEPHAKAFSDRSPGSVARVTVRPDARIASYDDLEAQWGREVEAVRVAEFQNPALGSNASAVIGNFGRWAMLHGYDGYWTPELSLVVLNRTAILMEDDGGS